MKKLLIIIGTCLLLTGCGNKMMINTSTVKDNLKTNEMFTDCVNFSKEDIKSKYNIDTTYILDDSLFMMPMKVNNANMYLIVHTSDGHINEVKEEMNKIMTSYENSWSMGYAPKEEDKVKNKLIEEKDNYLIYVISDDNDKVLENILNSK